MFKQLTIGLLFAISQWNLQSASINVIRYTVVIDDQQLPHTVTSINWLVLEIGTITDGLLLRTYLNLTHFTPGLVFLDDLNLNFLSENETIRNPFLWCCVVFSLFVFSPNPLWRTIYEVLQIWHPWGWSWEFVPGAV